MISVLMTIYKEPWDWIERALYSLKKQTYQDIELILVIDNPQSELIAKVKEYVDKNFDVSKIIINKENKGLVKSLNIAFSYANGSYIARMDSDDICYENRFSNEMEFIKKNNLDFVATAIDLIDTDGEKIKKVSLGKDLIGKQVKKLEKRTNQFWHPTWLLKREVMKNLGGYRAVPSAEDYDFVARALLEKYKLGILNKALVKKRINQNSISELDTYRQTLIAQSIAKGLKNGNEIDLNYLPNVTERDKKKYLEIKTAFVNRHNIKCSALVSLIMKLVGTSQGRIFLKSILLQKMGARL